VTQENNDASQEPQGKHSVALGVFVGLGVWLLTGFHPVGLGLGVFLGLLVASKNVAFLLNRTLDIFAPLGSQRPKQTGLETSFNDTAAQTDKYWSSYDGGKIWEQRSVEMEAQSTSLYGELRLNIPDLAVSSLQSYAGHIVQISPNEPLREFWSRYDNANLRGLGEAVGDDFPRAMPNSTSVPEFPPKPKPDYSHLPPHLALIGETQAVRQKLTAAAKIETGEFGNDLAKMVHNVDTIIDAIRLAPAKLGDVQRLFTYYLPEVGKLLEARLHMQAVGESERVAEIEAILDRIETAFQQFAARMHQADIRALDIDLKLLDQSLAAEFETQIGT
jgi:hypothetical protein